MKKYIITTLALCLVFMSACQWFTDGESAFEPKQYYVAVSGSDSNPGTFEEPFATIQKAVDVVEAGDTIWVRGGTYQPTSRVEINHKDGTASRRIYLLAYPNEVPIIDGSNVTGTPSVCLRLNHSSYWHIQGITATNSPQACFYLKGSSQHNEFIKCEAYNNKGSGWQMSFADGGYPWFCKYDRCVSHHNYDPQCHGNNADGFAGAGYEFFYRCEAYCNSDDGYDVRNRDYPVTYKECVAYDNGFDLWGDPEFFGGGGIWLQMRRSRYRTAYLYKMCSMGECFLWFLTLPE